MAAHPGHRVSLFGRLFPDATVELLLDHAVRLGYGGIDIRCDAPLPDGSMVLPPDTPPAQRRDLRRRLDDAGVAVPCIYTWTGRYLRLKDDAERQEHVLQQQRTAAVEQGTQGTNEERHPIQHGAMIAHGADRHTYGVLAPYSCSPR